MPVAAMLTGLLRAYLQRGDAMSRYFVQGQGEIRLSRTDFKAQGGEGAIYVKGSAAYKIYTDPARAIRPAKIQELSVLTQTNIIRPLNILLDGKNRPVGYAMRHIDKAYALCQLFPKAFRRRNNLTAEMTLRLVRQLQEGVRHVHAKGILIVDLNEMNFLVSEDFRELFFIDVDNYQTPSYPATALMESVRDRHARGFTTGSDFFSLAVVSFQMFVGIHPFKGTYPPLMNLPDKETRLDARMRANISVLRPEVSVPGACLPFSVIPPAYLDWYRAVFDEGKRLPPPDGAQPALTLTAPSEHYHYVGAGYFEVTELQEFDGDIIWHDSLFTVSEKSIYFGGKKYPKPQVDVKVAATPRLHHPVAAFMEGSRLRFLNLSTGQHLTQGIEGDDVMLCNGQFYIRQRENIFAVEFIELRSGSLPGLKIAANVMIASTRLFEGVAIQNLLGAYYASIFPAAGVCHQVRLPELDGHQTVEARLYRNILMVIGAREGLYDKLIFRFSDDFSGYDLRVVQNVSSTDINFTVLDGGVVLHLTEEGSLEVFSRHKNSSHIKTIQDPSIEGDTRLFHRGTQALMARGRRLYGIKMRQQPGGQAL
jgi:hypothetical protein